MKTGGLPLALVAAALGHFRCPATRAASSRMPSGLAIAGDIGVAERPLRAGQVIESRRDSVGKSANGKRECDSCQQCAEQPRVRDFPGTRDVT
jgi:hypothetical protein